MLILLKVIQGNFEVTQGQDKIQENTQNLLMFVWRKVIQGDLKVVQVQIPENTQNFLKFIWRKVVQGDLKVVQGQIQENMKNFLRFI